MKLSSRSYRFLICTVLIACTKICLVISSNSNVNNLNKYSKNNYKDAFEDEDFDSNNISYENNTNFKDISSRNNPLQTDGNNNDIHGKKSDNEAKTTSKKGIQYMITKKMRLTLIDDLGYLNNEIDEMEPQIAAVLIERSLPRPANGVPNSWKRPSNAMPIAKKVKRYGIAKNFSAFINKRFQSLKNGTIAFSKGTLKFSQTYIKPILPPLIACLIVVLQKDNIGKGFNMIHDRLNVYFTQRKNNKILKKKKKLESIKAVTPKSPKIIKKEVKRDVISNQNKYNSDINNNNNQNKNLWKKSKSDDNNKSKASTNDVDISLFESVRQQSFFDKIIFNFEVMKSKK
eukprot:gene5532-7649_t